ARMPVRADAVARRPRLGSGAQLLELLQCDVRLAEASTFAPILWVADACVFEDAGIEQVTVEGGVALGAVIELHRLVDLAVGGTGQAHLPGAGDPLGQRRIFPQMSAQARFAVLARTDQLLLGEVPHRRCAAGPV